MSAKTHSLKCTTNETKLCKAASKLRRLKIEENILLQALKKLDQKNNYEVSELYTTDMELKNMTKNIIDSYTRIKTLFEDIKIITNTQELLADVEVDEIKKKVLELETIMRSFKLQLNTELNSLKSAETILISEDVQEFQDFMKNSPNRYGGWNEYHHNIFVTLWKKYFGNALKINFTNLEFADKITFDNFTDECLLKLRGIDRNNLISHIDWYEKYLLLKSKQQIAIDKWKLNRRSMRKVTASPKQTTTQTEANPRKKICELRKYIDEATKPASKVISNDDIERLMKPTKQWLSRCNEDDRNMNQIFDIENLAKLGIPNWRQHIS